MYAIVRIGGQQYMATPDSTIRVQLLEKEVGSEVTLTEVLVWSDGDNVTIGQPLVEGKSIKAEVVRHAKDKKVIVFKKKRRKGYRKKNGHRQQFTELRLSSF